MKKFLFMLIFSLSPLTALPNTIMEKTWDFPLEEKSLRKGNIHLYVGTHSREKLTEDFPHILALDEWNVLKDSGSIFLVNKLAFEVHRRAETFSKDIIFTAKGFEEISQDTRITKIYQENKEKVAFRAVKGKWPANVEVSVDYHHHEQDAPKFEAYGNFLRDQDHLAPYYVTTQYLYDYNRFLNHSWVICSFTDSSLSPAPVDKRTWVVCYSLSSMPMKTYRFARMFVDMDKLFRGELEATVGNIKRVSEKIE